MKKLFFPIIAGCVLSMLAAPGVSLAKPRIVLDAAHGGSDTGVKGGSEVEKDWNYKIALALQKAFEAAGFEVVSIRRGDVTVPPDKRTEMINTSQSSAAIILHADREWTGKQNGPYIVVEPPSKPEGVEGNEIQKWGYITLAQYRSSLRLARAVGQKLGVGSELSNLSDNRGLAGEVSSPEGRIFCLPHQSLRYLILPSIVLTPLFLTSAPDLKKFSRAEYLADFAEKVVQGTAEFLQVSP